MSDRPSDRRNAPRHRGAETHGIVSTRVRPGHRATLLDVSEGGALIETAYRLLPGTSVELHIETAQRRACIRGRVLRCAVVGLCSTLICYRGAIGFDGGLPWPMSGSGNPLPAPAALEPHDWAANTRQRP